MIFLMETGHFFIPVKHRYSPRYLLNAKAQLAVKLCKEENSSTFPLYNDMASACSFFKYFIPLNSRAPFCSDKMYNISALGFKHPSNSPLFPLASFSAVVLSTDSSAGSSNMEDVSDDAMISAAIFVMDRTCGKQNVSSRFASAGIFLSNFFRLLPSSRVIPGNEKVAVCVIRCMMDLENKSSHKITDNNTSGKYVTKQEVNVFS